MTNDDTTQPGSERVIAGRYTLRSPLGEGGMGTVWRAHDKVLDRQVAIKEVRAPAALPVAELDRMYARLEREAWAAARVAHRNVVTIYDVVMEDKRPWIVMELVRGRSLADVLKDDGPLTHQHAASIGVEILGALRAAHETGVLHRDVKPANVLIAADGRVVLTDFGIATVEGSTALTMTGEVVGSPEYLAPERALGKSPGPASDLWSLGVLLYAAVEADSPFRQDSPLSTLRAVVDEALPAPRSTGALTSVIEGLLRKDPEQRLTGEQAAKDLELVSKGMTPSTGTLQMGTYSGTVRTQLVPSASPAYIAGQPTATYAPAQSMGADSEGVHAPVPATLHGPPETIAPGKRHRRTTIVAVSAAIAALALAGTGYALVNEDGGSKPNSSSTEAGADSGSAAQGKGNSSQGLRVTVTGSQTTYSGHCPPPSGQAPSFTATFTVDELPAKVSYRWVSSDGSVTDPQWRTLSFPEGGSLTKSDTVGLSEWQRAGHLESAVGVQVKYPLVGKSNMVPLSLTCATGTT
ncbi:serine/threonine protein kinase [Streptomyces sp. B3I7]|uniref:serine/threonine-protein kinase n=1 Tax=Streptomyces sp. B3I7 TaxID=3042269 RepID=UPI002782C397|nr:serine/threonine-protein kinase [Streptomyces sp. B3I7]MDQ0808383.1 serine/threonine protein kinase [Streptomyces sp. B3I7]